MRAIAFVVVTTFLLAACAGGANVASQAKAPSASPEMRAMYLSVIRSLAAQGKAEAALAFLDDYDLKYPKDPEAQEARGAALLQVKRTAEAATVFRTLDKEGYHAQADFGIGQVSALRADWSSAAHWFTKAALCAPTNVRYVNNQGYALLKIGKADAAYRVLARAVELAPKNRMARTNFVLAAMHSGHRAEARRVLKSLGPQDRERVMVFATGWSP